jgi:hypothetical protein
MRGSHVSMTIHHYTPPAAPVQAPDKGAFPARWRPRTQGISDGKSPMGILCIVHMRVLKKIQVSLYKKRFFRFLSGSGGFWKTGGKTFRHFDEKPVFFENFLQRLNKLWFPCFQMEKPVLYFQIDRNI